MHTYIAPVYKAFGMVADAEKAKGAKAYMKNKFEFFGIKMDERRKIFKDHMKQHGLLEPDQLEKIVKELWELPQREFQYCAIELMAFHKKVWPSEIIQLFEYTIVHKSWWDTVDFVCTECVSPCFKRYPEKIRTITRRWNKSSNIWLQRSSLLSQKNYKRDTDINLLSQYIFYLADSKEFFVQKAIGWILREYARVEPEWVKEFVANNKLAPLSKREALKHL